MNLDKEIPEWIMEAAEKYVGPYQSKHEKGMAESVARFFAEAFRETGLVEAVKDSRRKRVPAEVGHFPDSGWDSLDQALTRATKVRK